MSSWDINQVTLIGRLTADPVLRYSSQGNAFCTMGIAVGMRSFSRDKENNKEEVSYFNIVVFSKVAEICSEYLSKGKQVAVSGYLRQKRWEKDGQKFSGVDIIAERVQFLSPSGQKMDYQNQDSYASDNSKFKEHKKSELKNQKEDQFDNDEIPF